MECYESKDGKVRKYVHEDGSETAVKTSKTCLSPTDKNVASNKVTVFASVSSGCFMRCRFCWLTAKGIPFRPVRRKDVVDNVFSACQDAAGGDASLPGRFLKLSWMGMGEPWPLCETLPDMSAEILERIVSGGLVAGVDGIDVGTVLPLGGDDKDTSRIACLAALGRSLAAWPTNPAKDTSLSRLMVSLHAPTDSGRDRLLPGCSPLSRVSRICAAGAEAGVDVIGHYTLVNGINDSTRDAEGLAKWLSVNSGMIQIRLLALNACPGIGLTPSTADDMERFVKTLLENGIDIRRIRIQHSAGSEIKASCGMFLARKGSPAAGK